MRLRRSSPRSSLILLVCIACSLYGQGTRTGSEGMPRLVRQSGGAHLLVDGKPFLVIGGELSNSASSSISSMKPVWPRLIAMHFTSVITPLSWELIEPREGRLDFRLVDGLIREARKNKLHIVFLWLASWKNGMSSYVPVWVKENFRKYPRMQIQKNAPVEVLSALSEINARADANAFAALMRHIREVDGTAHTVVMMQVENEVGVLGDSRDRSPAADSAYSGAVPGQLMEYLTRNKEDLVPELKELWGKNGCKTSGNWEAVFGTGERCDEIFMAWYYALYVNRVAVAGKKEYPLPMYVNAWLDQECCPAPGGYPSGGPLAHVFDVWLAGAPAIDILAPDIYVPDYDNRCQKFSRRGNPLFIPEMNSGDDGAQNVFLAIGKYRAIGVSPFAVDRIVNPGESSLGKSYEIIGQLSPVILQKQIAGEITGFVVDEQHPTVRCDLGGYAMEVSLDEIFGDKSKSGYGLIMTDGPNRFIGAGCGFKVRFFSKTAPSVIVGIGSIDEGEAHGGVWIPGRRLNGDEDDQGRAWRFSPRKPGIEKCTVYTYER